MSAAEYRWYKYRIKWASGPSEWMYREIYASSTAEALETLHETYSVYVEHDLWRGLEVEPVDVPPEEIVVAQIAEARNMRDEAEERLLRYKDLLDSVHRDVDGSSKL